MKKYTYHSNFKSDLKRCFAGVTIIVLTTFLKLNSCGAGVQPYVPTQSGATRIAGQFFLIDKGVAIEMFDVKKHQPIFRNIILTGNERKVVKTKAKTAKQDSTAVSTQKEAGSTSESSKDEIIPILNIHRLH